MLRWSATQIQKSIWAIFVLRSLNATTQARKLTYWSPWGLFWAIARLYFSWILPNVLQALVSKRKQIICLIHTASWARENFPNHRFLPFNSVFQMATKATFLKYTFMHSTQILLVWDARLLPMDGECLEIKAGITCPGLDADVGISQQLVFLTCKQS